MEEPQDTYSMMTHHYDDVHTPYCKTCKKIDNNYTIEDPIQQSDPNYFHDFVPIKEEMTGGKRRKTRKTRKTKKTMKTRKTKKTMKTKKTRKHRGRNRK
jgi:hypothetical protein